MKISLFNPNSALQRIFLKMRIEFYEDLGEAMMDQDSLASSSWNLQDQLDLWRQRQATRGNKQAMVYGLILGRMRNQAMSFPEALEGIAPSMEVMSLTASEQNGDIGKGLVVLAHDAAALDEMQKMVRGELIEPALLFVMIVAIFLGFSIGFVPVLTQLIPAEKLPVMGKILYYVSLGVVNYGIFFAAAFIAAVAWFVWSLPNFIGRTRDRMDRWIGYSMYRDYNAARFLQSLANLLKADVSLYNSLMLLRSKASPWLQSHIARIMSQLDSGALPQDAFTTGILSQRIEDRLQDFAQRSNFPAAIQKLGENTAKNVLVSLKNSSLAIKTAMKILMAVVVGFVLVALLQSVFESTNTIKSTFTSSRAR